MPAQAAQTAYVGFSEMPLSTASGWCVTALNPNVVDSSIVLGVCANAYSQEWSAVFDGTFFVIENESGLCVTYVASQGAPDGVHAVLGQCVYAAIQRFYREGGTYGQVWYMPYVTDNNGNHLAINDANYVLKAYNPINSSYYCPSCKSENWIGPTEYDS